VGPDCFFPYFTWFIPPFKREPDRHAVAFVRLHAPLIRTAPTHILFASLSLSLSLSLHASAPRVLPFGGGFISRRQQTTAPAAMTAADGESCAVVATAADIICSLRGADLAGWTPPWRKHEAACEGDREEEGGGGDEARDLTWPAVARGKRSRSRRESPSASGSAASADAKKKKARRGVRGSPASPLDYSGGSGSGASTSGGEDGAFCFQPEPAFPPAAACQLAEPAVPPPPPPPPSEVRACVRAYLTSDIPVPVSCWFGRLLCCGLVGGWLLSDSRSCLGGGRTDGPNCPSV
jgi:hypothetical protein